jgi:hypothetical protein
MNLYPLEQTIRCTRVNDMVSLITKYQFHQVRKLEKRRRTGRCLQLQLSSVDLLLPFSAALHIPIKGEYAVTMHFAEIIKLVS